MPPFLFLIFQVSINVAMIGFIPINKSIDFKEKCIDFYEAEIEINEIMNNFKHG